MRRIIYFDAQRPARDGEPPGKRFRVVVGTGDTTSPFIEVQTLDAAGDPSWRRAGGFSHDDVSRILGRAISTLTTDQVDAKIELGPLPRGVLL